MRIALLYLTRWSVLLLLAAGLLAGCDTRDEDEGRFEAILQPAGAGSGGAFGREGRALFSLDDDGAFTLDLVPRSDAPGTREGILFARTSGGVPSAGERYPLVSPNLDGLPDGLFGAAVYLGSSLYYATDGTLVIETVSEERIGGTFRFDATLTERSGNPGAPPGLRVEGVFEAERGPTDRFPE